MNAVLQDLRKLSPDLFASQHIFETVPFIVNGNLSAYVAWADSKITRKDSFWKIREA